jgi:ABC-type multidrug transport system ATPase subunit
MQLTINQLCKRYPNGVQALNDVSLTIPTGMFGLLGPNGAGKSTLMRTIATLQDADSGSVFLDALDVLKEKDEVRKLLGYLPQDFGLYPKVSAKRMLKHFATLKGIGPARHRREVCDQLLQKTNLYDVRNQHLGGFSGGMKQRFGIALALLGSPKLIIVDEPTAGLDPEERTRFHNLLCEIAEGVIVILSTHIVGDVSDLCQRMAVMHQGCVILTGEPLELVNGLQGQVWQKDVDKTQLVDHDQRFQVISTRLFAGRSIIHVLSEQQPDETFDTVKPDLQDVYFSAIKQHHSDVSLANVC